MYIFKRREGRDEESKERRDDSNMLFILWATGRAQAYRTTFWLNLQHIKTEKHQNRTLHLKIISMHICPLNLDVNS